MLGRRCPGGHADLLSRAVQCQPDETVVFSWVTWPSRAERDAGWQKVMADPRMQSDANPMPLDAKRLIYGGFQVLLAA